MSILIKDIDILSMEKDGDHGLKPVTHGSIVIEGQNIKAVGNIAIEDESIFDSVIEGKNLLAMPGLVNTHSHAAMSLFRGYADDMGLMQWLFDKIFPMEAKLIAEDVRSGSELAILEMIKSGTTTFSDMYFFLDETAKVVKESGIRAYLAPGITDPKVADCDPITTFLDLYEKWHGMADGRLHVIPGPHAPYTCSPDLIRRVVKEAKKHHLPMHIHIAETNAENEQIMDRYHKRPVEYLADLGFFDGAKVLAAHGVYLNASDISYLSDKDITVLHNPRSNMKLASGIAPVEALLQAGINVSLGTDSACSNNNLDMFQEMRAAAYVAKLKELDPESLPVARVLEMATINGAKGLGFEGGMLKTGMFADIILIDMDKPHLTPLYDHASHLVYAASGSDVDTVIVNGQLLMKHRELLTIDEEKVKAKANSAIKRLLEA